MATVFVGSVLPACNLVINSGSGITLKRECGELVHISATLTGVGTDATASTNPTYTRGGTLGGFGQIIPTTLT